MALSATDVQDPGRGPDRCGRARSTVARYLYCWYRPESLSSVAPNGSGSRYSRSKISRGAAPWARLGNSESAPNARRCMPVVSFTSYPRRNHWD